MVGDIFHHSEVYSLSVSHTSHDAKLRYGVDNFKLGSIRDRVTNLSIVNQKRLLIVSNALVVLFLEIFREGDLLVRLAPKEIWSRSLRIVDCIDPVDLVIVVLGDDRFTDYILINILWVHILQRDFAADYPTGIVYNGVEIFCARMRSEGKTFVDFEGVNVDLWLQVIELRVLANLLEVGFADGVLDEYVYGLRDMVTLLRNNRAAISFRGFLSDLELFNKPQSHGVCIFLHKDRFKLCYLGDRFQLFFIQLVEDEDGLSGDRELANSFLDLGFHHFNH